MNFQEFIASKVYNANLPEKLGIDEDCVNKTGYIYDDFYYIEIIDGKPDSYILLLDREIYESSNLQELEEKLFKFVKEYLE